jgi:oligopeptide/dipeptide ABC transporter ATP-binding protein
MPAINASPALTATGRDPAGEVLLEVVELRTSFFIDGVEHRAVDGASFVLRRGRILALVGESGCGKSVTAYSILRLIQPPGRIVGGSIRFHARVADRTETIEVAALSERDDRLYRLRGGLASMIFQEPMTALSPVHTIGNQITEAILLHQDVTPATATRLAAEMLGKVGIPDPTSRLRQYPHELSGGMRQRVVIAMALVCQPQLLIADEPTTALDVTIQAQILRLIRSLQRDLDTAVMLITHDLGVVAQTADDVAVMYLGRIVEHGSVRQILQRPRHPYTAGLLASRPSLTRSCDRLPAIAGTVPGLAAVPPGCPFHPRCRHARAGVCDIGAPPPLRVHDDGRQVACVRLEELA